MIPMKLLQIECCLQDGNREDHIGYLHEHMYRPVCGWSIRSVPTDLCILSSQYLLDSRFAGADLLCNDRKNHYSSVKMYFRLSNEIWVSLSYLSENQGPLLNRAWSAVRSENG